MRYYYYKCSRKSSTFTGILGLIGAIFLFLGLFFLALPVFLAAFAVFSIVAAYVGWRVRKALKRFEEELERKDWLRAEEAHNGCVIDITKEPLE